MKFLVDAQLPRRLALWLQLLSLFVKHEEIVFRLLAEHEFIELSRSQVIVHR